MFCGGYQVAMTFSYHLPCRGLDPSPRGSLTLTIPLYICASSWGESKDYPQPLQVIQAALSILCSLAAPHA